MIFYRKHFLKALTYRDKFTQNTNFKAWIYTIMKNTFINDYRRNVKTKNTFDGSNNDFHLLFSKDKVYPAPDSFYSSKEIQKVLMHWKMSIKFHLLCFWMDINTKKLLKNSICHWEQ